MVPPLVQAITDVKICECFWLLLTRKRIWEGDQCPIPKPYVGRGQGWRGIINRVSLCFASRAVWTAVPSLRAVYIHRQVAPSRGAQPLCDLSLLGNNLPKFRKWPRSNVSRCRPECALEIWNCLGWLVSVFEFRKSSSIHRVRFLYVWHGEEGGWTARNSAIEFW